MTPAKSYPYAVVNVLTTEPLSGNSLAVFPDASEFDPEMMQKIARELNLTETAFVHPASRSDCAARVRIFAPTKETPFAGHPTVGTAFVLLQKGIVSSSCHEFLLEEEIGPIPLRIEAGTPAADLVAYTCDSRRAVPGRLSLCDSAWTGAARPACRLTDFSSIAESVNDGNAPCS